MTTCTGWALAALVFGSGYGFELSSNRGEPLALKGTHWDWTGVIGTGQSLSVGARALPVLSTVQPYGNLKLSTGKLPWPIDPNDAQLAMAPLVEPIGRMAPDYPSSWPENIDGETPHTAAANEISALYAARFHRDFVSVHSAVGEDGQGMVFLKKGAEHKGLNGHSYEAAMIETRAIARLAQAAKKSYGVGAIFVTHGETDAGNVNYEKELFQLWTDYNSDLKKITGQHEDVLMIVSQQNSINDHSPSTQAQWKIGVDHRKNIVCSGPKYQYPYFQDGVHLTAEGYRLLGEKYGQIFFQQAILGKEWVPLEPTDIRRKNKVITIRFQVPSGPLVWDISLSAPHPSTPEWSKGNGFEVRDSHGARIAIESAVITKDGRGVTLTCETDPGPDAVVSYAMEGEKVQMKDGTFRWGLLRDSADQIGATTGKYQPNFCVAFDWKMQ